MNPIKQLQQYGQSPWLDYIKRSLIVTGELKNLIEEDGLKGMTSNPAIFEKAIAGSDDYAELIQYLKKENLNTTELYEKLAIRDIQDAADVMRTVYDDTQRRDGYISLEVSPHLAKDTQGTIKEAQRLWKAVNRENLMIKVPATIEGLPAIRQLISEGINVNVTLLFSKSFYEKVADAYISGLEERVSQGGDISKIASVASFFISRIDSAVDGILNTLLQQSSEVNNKKNLENLLGKAAIANARLTYQSYKELYQGSRWMKLSQKGAMTQRLLWASTSTKNPTYRDVLYVEELIGPDTVNTIPPATFDAFRDHGKLRASLEENVQESKQILDSLNNVGISLDKVADDLITDGIRLFVEPFDKLLKTLGNVY